MMDVFKSVCYHGAMSIEESTGSEHIPIYNIKAVSRLVGLLPVTLRAWERRYGLPTPKRGGQGYRLYSDYDVRILRWLKAQIDAGLSISRASELLNDLRVQGVDPAVDATQRVDLVTSPEVLRKQLLKSLTHFDEGSASEALRRAFSLYAVDQVLEEMIKPTLVTLGEAWHRGEISIVVEHFATQFCIQNLMSMLSAAAAPSRQGMIVAACAPGERHQIGLLMMVVMLRWRGWDVKYLGQDLALDKLAEALLPLHPRMLLFTATRPEAAQALQTALPEALAGFPEPHPAIIVGGQAFEQPGAMNGLPAIYLNAPPSQMIHTIEQIMEQNNSQRGNNKHSPEPGYSSSSNGS